MTSKDGPHSNPYRPTELCCLACCFGEREHAEWCPERDLASPATHQELATQFSALFHPCDDVDESDFNIQVYPPLSE